MRWIATLLIGVAAFIASLAASAQSQAPVDLSVPLAVSVNVEARSAPSSSAGEAVAALVRGERIFVREEVDDFLRIDASQGISGPAFIPRSAVAPMQPPPVCECPNQLRSGDSRCGANSSFCRHGGREGQCYLGETAFEQACAPAAT